MHVSAASFSQNVSFSGKDVPVDRIFSAIEEQTGYFFFYKQQDIERIGPLSVSVKNMPVQELLSICLRNQPLAFVISDNTIIISHTGPRGFSILAPPRVTVRGKVVDDMTGMPVIAASIAVKGSKAGTSTDKDGNFVLAYESDGHFVIVISSIGYETKEVTVTGNALLTIRLTMASSEMKNVVISNGLLTRRKESFTGATSSYSGEELRTIGNRNLITSLKTLDPSFIIVENNLQGANPNALPAIELRGKTSITTTEVNSQFASDPNLPLFILDGFETTLDVINKLDMNRVSTVTILKDAASTAMYGSRAANGVIVVETRRPASGELRVSYTGDFQLELPDIGSYNMMNAAEKLEFERLSGMYTAPDAADQYLLDQEYNAKLAEVRRGVGTDWINIPIRNGFSNSHSLLLTGGSRELLFSGGLFYKQRTGVMKGSDLDNYGANIDINYRRGKLNVMNMLYVSGSTGNESNYGSFSDYVNTNPYFRKVSADGSIPEYLDLSSNVRYAYNDPALNGNIGYSFTEPVPNPLYNASFAGINQEKTRLLQNNLRMIWDLSSALRLQGGFQVSNATNTGIRFIPPENTQFDGRPLTEKGQYTNTRTEQNTYSGNLMLTYAQLINDVHQVNANIRTDIREDAQRSLGVSAVGFPDGTNGNPAFAYSYQPYSAPQSASQVTRTNTLLGSVGYAYKLRYLLDASYNLSGSNAFGSDNKFSTSWVVGLGWNIHREAFLSHLRWLDLLKIYGNIGRTGNQQLGVYSSTSVYSAMPVAYLFGSGLDVSAVGNPGLEWQNTLQKSVGMDITALDNRISAQLTYYEKLTKPLVIGAESSFFPSSVGLTSAYPINLGELLVKGWEATLRFSPIYRKKEMTIWTLSANASANHGKFRNMANALDVWNKEQTQKRATTRYMDGNSPDDIWTVESLGIDPATGKELFRKKDGSVTTVYSTEDIVKTGNSRPSVQGVLSSNFTYKGFTLNIGLRYSLGGKILNNALFDKVENISLQSLKYNQDKRALYDRWQKPGDVSQFKAIDITQYTPITSRFMQTDNFISGETISIGWRFYHDSWIRKLYMQTLDLRLYSFDLFRISNVRAERGIDYPFSRSLSFGINASF